jgi:hypothetical protein
MVLDQADRVCGTEAFLRKHIKKRKKQQMIGGRESQRLNAEKRSVKSVSYRLIRRQDRSQYAAEWAVTGRGSLS